ncbi:MAG: AAA family ATPase [Candidatus Marinimicrobia bacterium]|nr:AAA family ATPase [Candidatus Neomarinimicrobiota bacterium]
MSIFRRYITFRLEDWKTRSNRKPVVLRGARQVGKTTLVKQFSQAFQNTIMLNLEKSDDLRYFEDFKNVNTLTESLFLKNNLSMDDKDKTLLFIDEIQESPQAINMLRYFYEEIPELYVIAAGSLLEFALKDIEQFPVARVEFLYLHPLNFPEYLEAKGLSELLKKFQEIPVPKSAHRLLLDEFNRYVIMGGMPEVISQYLDDGNLTNLPGIYESIWTTYKYDIEKYASNSTEKNVLKHIMDTAPLSLDQRIKFNNFGRSNYKSREVGEAMRLLDTARVIRLIYPSTSIKPPIIPDLRKSPRLQFLDTGIVNYTLGIQAEMLKLDDLSNEYRGSIIPHIITQELISMSSLKDEKPCFWVRESHKTTSEVDLLIKHRKLLIPVEIKSGKTGKLRSLHQFIDASEHPYAIRLYAGKFSIDEHQTPSGTPYYLMNLPYYCATKLNEYVEYLVETKS